MKVSQAISFGHCLTETLGFAALIMVLPHT